MSERSISDTPSLLYQDGLAFLISTCISSLGPGICCLYCGVGTFANPTTAFAAGITFVALATGAAATGFAGGAVVAEDDTVIGGALFVGTG